MLIVLSPAKTLDFDTPVPVRQFTQPDFLPAAEKLVKALRKLSPEELSRLMAVSGKIGELNFSRFMNWHQPFSEANARQAIYAFKGDVYTGLAAASFKVADLKYAQQHLRILSGLYGVLRPLDLMQPYRLEMGTAFASGKNRNLYEYWRGTVTAAINAALEEQRQKVLINLASTEYFKVLDLKSLDARVVTPVFKDARGGQFKVISFYAKKARGLMAAWIIRERIKTVKGLEAFSLAGYGFNAALSQGDELVFTRRLQ
ncbi:MAG: peroxide stress protein YaaA [Pseudomonadales bacterium]|nr:peroxide stress protein YaaA [Pseudomonadales bacterium]